MIGNVGSYVPLLKNADWHLLIFAKIRISSFIIKMLFAVAKSYLSILWGRSQEVEKNSCPNHGAAVYITRNLLRYIISSKVSISRFWRVYHQAAGEPSPKEADEIQGRLAALDDIHRTLCGDDMPSLRLG